MANSDELYDVKRFVDTRISEETGLREFKIWWRGWGSKDNSWEPSENCNECHEHLNDLNRRRIREGKSPVYFEPSLQTSLVPSLRFDSDSKIDENKSPENMTTHQLDLGRKQKSDSHSHSPTLTSDSPEMTHNLKFQEREDDDGDSMLTDDNEELRQRFRRICTKNESYTEASLLESLETPAPLPQSDTNIILSCTRIRSRDSLLKEKNKPHQINTNDLDPFAYTCKIGSKLAFKASHAMHTFSKLPNPLVNPIVEPNKIQSSVKSIIEECPNTSQKSSKRKRSIKKLSQPEDYSLRVKLRLDGMSILVGFIPAIKKPFQVQHQNDLFDVSTTHSGSTSFQDDSLEKQDGDAIFNPKLTTATEISSGEIIPKKKSTLTVQDVVNSAEDPSSDFLHSLKNVSLLDDPIRIFDEMSKISIGQSSRELRLLFVRKIFNSCSVEQFQSLLKHGLLVHVACWFRQAARLVSLDEEMLNVLSRLVESLIIDDSKISGLDDLRLLFSAKDTWLGAGSLIKGTARRCMNKWDELIFINEKLQLLKHQRSRSDPEVPSDVFSKSCSPNESSSITKSRDTSSTNHRHVDQNKLPQIAPESCSISGQSTCLSDATAIGASILRPIMAESHQTESLPVSSPGQPPNEATSRALVRSHPVSALRSSVVADPRLRRDKLVPTADFSSSSSSSSSSSPFAALASTTIGSRLLSVRPSQPRHVLPVQSQLRDKNDLHIKPRLPLRKAFVSRRHGSHSNIITKPLEVSGVLTSNREFSQLKALDTSSEANTSDMTNDETITHVSTAANHTVEKRSSSIKNGLHNVIENLKKNNRNYTDHSGDFGKSKKCSSRPAALVQSQINVACKKIELETDHEIQEMESPCSENISNSRITASSNARIVIDLVKSQCNNLSQNCSSSTMTKKSGTNKNACQNSRTNDQVNLGINLLSHAKTCSTSEQFAVQTPPRRRKIENSNHIPSSQSTAISKEKFNQIQPEISEGELLPASEQSLRLSTPQETTALKCEDEACEISVDVDQDLDVSSEPAIMNRSKQISKATLSTLQDTTDLKCEDEACDTSLDMDIDSDSSSETDIADIFKRHDSLIDRVSIPSAQVICPAFELLGRCADGDLCEMRHAETQALTLLQAMSSIGVQMCLPPTSSIVSHANFQRTHEAAGGHQFKSSVLSYKMTPCPSFALGMKCADGDKCLMQHETTVPLISKPWTQFDYRSAAFTVPPNLL